MEMLVKLPKIPKETNARANCQAFCAKPRLVKLKTYINEAKGKMRSLPKRVTNFPEKNIIDSCPIGKANRIVPSSPSLKCSAALIVGIRLAQVANDKPIPK